MRIGGFLKSSTTDFPGRTAAVIFTQGCNWRCPFCSNPGLVIPDCYGETIPEERVLAYLQRRKDRLTGVVVTGGEPTLQGDLLPFLEKLRKSGWAIKLDTNGSRPDVLREVLRRGLVDYLAMDVKAPLANYAQAVGTRVDAEPVRTSLWLVKNSGIEHEFRTTVIPGLHTVQELKEIGNMVQGARHFYLQEFASATALRADFRNRVAFTRKTLDDLGAYFRSRVADFGVRSGSEAVSVPDADFLKLGQLAETAG